MARKTRARRNLVGELPPGLGPYEFWNFGPGKDYVSSLQNPSRYLAALAELEHSQTRQKLPRGTAAPEIWLPTLWKPILADGKPFQPRFVPFVIDKKLAAVQDDPAQLRLRLLSGVTQKKIRQHLEYVDIEKSRFRVGAPVAERAMKPKVQLEPTAPDWHPDGRLRARLGAEKRITIFAVIDNGLPFAHRNFRDASGRRSRVE